MIATAGSLFRGGTTRCRRFHFRSAVRRFVLPGLVALSLLGGGSVVASEGMIEVSDLREEARRARAENLVLVIEFFGYYCEYCRKLEAMFLLPMQRNRDYARKVLIRGIPLSPYDSIIDFDGNRVRTEDFADRYGVSLTPTLVFLNSEGVEMSEKLVGIWSEDFFGGFIDERIDRARAGL